LPAEKQVLSHRQVGQQIDLLIDGSDAGFNAASGERGAISAPSSRTVPASRGTTPVGDSYGTEYEA
jgi:hypothetical protein